VIENELLEAGAQTSRLVVITGGPGSGKTSVVDHLASLGYPTVPEAAIQLIDELNRERGLAGQVAWRKQHQAEFSRRVMARQVALEGACKIPEGTIGFCDRGRPDVLAYAELAGHDLDSEMRRLVECHRYLGVFLLDTLSRFPDRPETGRTSDRERSLRLAERLEATYRSLGYEPVRVPERPVAERAGLVLLALSARSRAG
jgi:predicted ATPase